VVTYHLLALTFLIFQRSNVCLVKTIFQAVFMKWSSARKTTVESVIILTNNVTFSKIYYMYTINTVHFLQYDIYPVGKRYHHIHLRFQYS